MEYNIVGKINLIVGNLEEHKKSFFTYFFKNINVDPSSFKYDENNNVLTMIGNGDIFIKIEFGETRIRITAQKENICLEKDLRITSQRYSGDGVGKLRYRNVDKYTETTSILFKTEEGIYTYIADDVYNHFLYYDCTTLNYLKNNVNIDLETPSHLQEITGKLFIGPDMTGEEYRYKNNVDQKYYFFYPNKLVEKTKELILEKKSAKKH